jgi:small GTP-binding protein
VKVILVGDGSAGKTTLCKRLRGLDPDPRESQTHGIEIHDFAMHCARGSILVHFWDFGGQEIMHATHQFFLSRRSLYILVLDGRKEEDADYWLKHIESFGGESPVVIALNKVDQNPGFEVNRKGLQDKYPGIRGFFRLNCLDKADAGVRDLLEFLPAQLADVEMARSSWPTRWYNVKKRLQKENKPYIENREFVELCNEEKILDEMKQKTLIRYLNDLGVALHFEDSRLNLLQILNPHWATEAVYRIINAKTVADAHGLLKLDAIPAILKRCDGQRFDYPPEKHGYIVDLMKKFELCYELSSARILLPDLLDVQEPKFRFPSDGGPILRFRFDYDFLPRSIMPRFIVKLHADIEGKLRWRTGVVLKNRDTGERAVIRSHKNDRRISIEVEGRLRREFFAVIRHQFDLIHDDFQKFDVKRKVPLPDNPGYAVDYDDLLYHEEKGRKTILIGELRKEYPVKNLLDGIESTEKRRRARSWGNRSGDTYNVAGDLYQGDDMSRKTSIKVGDHNQNVNINQAVAEKIEGSFNRANDATNKSDEIRTLLKQLAQEVAKIAEAQEPAKAEDTANHLEVLTTQATSEKPNPSYWKLSKEGIIDAAKAVGEVGKTAIELLAKLGPWLNLS